VEKAVILEPQKMEILGGVGVERVHFQLQLELEIHLLHLRQLPVERGFQGGSHPHQRRDRVVVGAVAVMD
jgi:hypothetical protein